MGKTNQSKKTNNNPKKAKVSSINKKQSERGGGIDEIDSLFAEKKQSNKQLQQQITHEKEIAKKERQRRKQARLEEEADEVAIRGLSSSSAAIGSSSTAAGKRKGDSKAPTSLHERATKLSSLTYTRADLEQLNDSKKKEAKDKWASDGLGGVFNGEGYTGRRDDGGHRVFKAHLMNRDGFGDTPDCPFDCQCCFI